LPDDAAKPAPTAPVTITGGDPGAPFTGAVRPDRDSLGEMNVPAEAYWGIHTARALENFPITRRPISVYPDLIRAIARVKQAAARANREIGVLESAKADIIERVCQEIVDGALHEQFVVG